MQLIQNGTQSATLPAPQAAVGTPGYAYNGLPGLGSNRTLADGDILNALIGEMQNICTGGGQVLAPGIYSQAWQAICSISLSGFLAFSGGTANLTDQQTGFITCWGGSSACVFNLPSVTGVGVGTKTGFGGVGNTANPYYIMRGDGGTGTITINTNGTDHIIVYSNGNRYDVGTSITLRNRPVLLFTGGINWTAIFVSGMEGSGVFENAAGTYSVSIPLCVSLVCLRRCLAGGGGGGGASGAGAYGAGGAAGGEVRNMWFPVPPNTTLTVVVGAGGSHGSVSGATNGGAGGNTTVSIAGGTTLAIVYGGAGGAGSSSGFASYTGTPASPVTIYPASIYPAQAGGAAFSLGGGAVFPAIGASPQGFVNSLSGVGTVSGAGGNGGVNGVALFGLSAGDGGKGADGLVELEF